MPAKPAPKRDRNKERAAQLARGRAAQELFYAGDDVAADALYEDPNLSTAEWMARHREDMILARHEHQARERARAAAFGEQRIADLEARIKAAIAAPTVQKLLAGAPYKVRSGLEIRIREDVIGHWECERTRDELKAADPQRNAFKTAARWLRKAGAADMAAEAIKRAEGLKPFAYDLWFHRKYSKRSAHWLLYSLNFRFVREWPTLKTGQRLRLLVALVAPLDPDLERIPKQERSEHARKLIDENKRHQEQLERIRAARARRVTK